MAAPRSRLLELDDQLLVHILSRERDLQHAANACRRLCKLARLLVEVFRCDEETGVAVDQWPAEYTFAGCRGLEYYTPDVGMAVEVQGEQNPAQLVLPLLTALLPHACAHWKQLRELALVLQPDQQAGVQRHANAYVAQQLPQLTALHSLRHLQLYKTAPLLLEDMQRLGQLTQLTSLLLADQSYMPGAAAMVPVDISPLAGLTQLQSLAIAGICPRPPAAKPQGLAAWLSPAELSEWVPGARTVLLAAAEGLRPSSSSSSNSRRSSCIAEMPTSLTSLVIKRADDVALKLWSFHLPLLTALRDVRVLEYLEPHGSPEFDAFPSPLISRLAPFLTELTQLAFEISDVDNPRTWRGYNVRAAALPAGHHLLHLKHLRAIDLTNCQIGVQTTADWQALAGLARLTCLYGIDAMCAPPASWQLPELQLLGISNARCWASAGHMAVQLQPEPAGLLGGQGQVGQPVDGIWHLNATFPKLIDVALNLHSAAQWLGVQPVVAELTGLTRICLDMEFRLNEASACMFEQLGHQLPALRTMYVVYSGGPDGWRLPRMHSYTQLDRLSLQLTVPGVSVPDDEHDAHNVNDTVLLAHLLPLRGLTELMLCRMPNITSGGVLGLCAAMTKLVNLDIVHCQEVREGDSEHASWEASELQVARAALQDAAAQEGRVACTVSVYLRERDAVREWRVLPCEVSYVTAHQQQF